MRNEKDQIRRVNVSPKKFFEYAKNNNIDVYEMHKILPIEILNQFITGPQKFPSGQMPMMKKNKCFICNKKTCWLDKIHGLYMCSEQCRDIIDERYNNGEDFEPHPIYVKLCDSIMEEFEENE
ncbi:hypothetical protein D3C87_78410 [compost metagenome]